MGHFDITFTALGEPASKANSRKMVTIRGRPALIKSQKARDYVKQFELQCPQYINFCFTCRSFL